MPVLMDNELPDEVPKKSKELEGTMQGWKSKINSNMI